MKGRILFVDDDRALGDTVLPALERREFSVTFRTSGAEALEFLALEDVDVVATDLNMSGMSGIELCGRIAANRPDIPVVVITAFGSLETAVAAIRAGAYDFITKPFDLDVLTLTLERAVEHRRLREELRRLTIEVADARGSAEIAGKSAAIRELLDLISRVAATDSSVLVTGESGTGKELVAKSLHSRSRRASGPFVVVNCAGIPEPLLESELFGHVKGAFTDARSARTGLFLQADKGTLFLDEIGEMPLALQPKLLRALQERTVRPVGSDREVPFDARVVSATHRDLDSLIEEGRFRQDLYFRLAVIQIPVPPLRARGGDVLLLAQQFLAREAARAQKKVAALSAAAAQKLSAYSWPGNVRELGNCIERAVALARFEEITLDDLPEKIREYRSSQLAVASDDPGDLLTMDEVEKRYVMKVLEAVGGNKTLAARALGFDRKTLYRKLERYGLATGD